MEVAEPIITALQVAKAATAGLPIPGLGTVLDTALGIARKAKEIKDTRDGCRALAEHAADLTLAVYRQLKSGSGETATKAYVADLLYDLQDIETVIDRHLHSRKGKRSLFSFAFKHGKIAKDVKDLREKLDRSHRKFMIQAILDNDQRMQTLTTGHLRIMQHIDDSANVADLIRGGISDLAQRVGNNGTFDGNFRFFARENLDFLEPVVDRPSIAPKCIGDERAYTHGAGGLTRHVPRYRAVVQAAGDLSGTRVVVHTYPNRKDRRFNDYVKSAKQICGNPYTLMVLGYSRPGELSEAAYIVTEEYYPFREYIDPMSGSGKLQVWLKMMAEISMAIDHLETVTAELGALLDPGFFVGCGDEQYEFGLDEVVYDPRHGGRIKWARSSGLAQSELESDGDEHCEATIPANGESRKRLVDNIRAAARADADGDTVMKCWFTKILLRPDLPAIIPGRSSSVWWHDPLPAPRGTPLGTWLERKPPDNGYWSVSGRLAPQWTALPAERRTRFGLWLNIATTPQVVPWLGSGSYPPKEYFQSPWSLSRNPPGSEEQNYLAMKFNTAEEYVAPVADRREMGVDFVFAGEGASSRMWKRYQFSSVPVGTVYLFRQDAHISNDGDAVSDLVHSLPDLTRKQQRRGVGIATGHFYHTETVIEATPETASEQAPPLWFFLLTYDDDEQHAINGFSFPFGFWSLEKNPTAVPSGMDLRLFPDLEFIHGGVGTLLATWTQEVAGYVATIKTKMCTNVMELSKDELLALKELRKSHISTGCAVCSEADGSGHETKAKAGDHTARKKHGAQGRPRSAAQRGGHGQAAG